MAQALEPNLASDATAALLSPDAGCQDHTHAAPPHRAPSSNLPLGALLISLAHRVWRRRAPSSRTVCYCLLLSVTICYCSHRRARSSRTSTTSRSRRTPQTTAWRCAPVAHPPDDDGLLLLPVTACYCLLLSVTVPAGAHPPDDDGHRPGGRRQLRDHGRALGARGLRGRAAAQA